VTRAELIAAALRSIAFVDAWARRRRYTPSPEYRAAREYVRAEAGR
jgi:hypothetical protein